MLRAASGLRRLLVRLPTWVGDAVMATPALRALRATCPRAEIIAQGRPRLLDLLDGAGLYDRAIPTASGRSRTRANVQAIREVAPDAAILLPHSFRVAWETFRARVPLRLGYSRQGRVALLTDSIPPHRQSGRILPVPMAQEYLELAAVLGASGDGRGPRLAIPEDVRARGLEALERLGIGPTESFFTLNPGASFGPSKVYPVELLARAADLIEEREGLRGLILCGPGEESLARDLEAKRCEETPSTAAAPLPLDLLKVALERAEFLITTDTGPRHIATALGTPVVVLMGPTDPRYSASNLERTVVLRRDVPCGPCHRKACPFDHHRCLREIPPEEVAEAASRLHAAGRETARRSGRPGELDSSAGTGFRAGC